MFGIRSYMAATYDIKKFMVVVVSYLNFVYESLEDKFHLAHTDSEFIVFNKNHKVILENSFIDKLKTQNKNPFALDRYILEEFEKQGYVFDKSVSPYIYPNFQNTK